MRKTTKQFVAIGLILLAMYNIVLFAIAGFADHEAPFWISYVFVLIAFGMMALTAMQLGRSGLVLRDWLFGFPIIRHCAIYVVLEVVVSAIFMALEYDIGWAWPLVIQLLMVGVYAVFMLSALISKTAITQVGEKAEKKTRYIALLQADVQVLCQACDDPELKAKLQKLAEDVRFSDPMSSEVLEGLEQDLCATVADCKKAIEEKDYALAESLCNKAALQLSERNLKCKARK